MALIVSFNLKMIIQWSNRLNLILIKMYALYTILSYMYMKKLIPKIYF